MMKPQILSVPSEDAMLDLLSGLNSSGIHPELACTLEGGAVFLASLTEPDAGHVHISNLSENGQVGCCNCMHEGTPCTEWCANRWEPAYPVFVMVTQLPGFETCVQNEIDAWWAAPPVDDRPALEAWLDDLPIKDDDETWIEVVPS